MIAAVRGPTAAAAASGSIRRVVGSGSTNLGRAPTAQTACRGDEGVGRDDHLVTGPDAEAHQDQLEGVGPVADPDAVPVAAVRRELGLERLDLRAPDEASMPPDCLPGQVELAAHLRVDLRDVQERDRPAVHGVGPMLARGTRGEGGCRCHDRSRVDEGTPTGVRAELLFGDTARAMARGG